MGGRGGSSGLSVGGGRDTVEYEPRTRGQITKYEAGVLYKAVKNGQVKALPETTKMMYEESDRYIRYASERYNQDYLFYDRVTDLTKALLNNRYSDAQKIISKIERDKIKKAGKKSGYYKYRKK